MASDCLTCLRCGALHVGDHILAIDETNLEHISVAEAMQLLRCGTPEHIKLEILPMRPTQHSKVSELSPRLGECWMGYGKFKATLNAVFSDNGNYCFSVEQWLYSCV